ncbi:recombinase family protein [Butyricicoccus sp.]|uniref:recombinase family protein n=1 Tax=Butyricicoccus sp. TaxID=2049021 RepID=UPI003AAD0065
MAKRVMTIMPTLVRFTEAPIAEHRKRKVAAYARVSTDSDEQFTSYEAQIDYYTQYIKARDDWEFIQVYTDEGITGTSTKHREGFKQMVADALEGKIDLIVTKSVSRFARNTVDSLTTIRQLKDKGVECFFEKENIWTFDGKGELLITIMSSLAQEESRSISENCTWGQRKRMADGRVSVPFDHFLGYERGENGELVINEEQAKTVRLIYDLFLQGLTPHTIANRLTAMGILTPRRKAKWNQGTVRSILTNEKYKGDALMQKCYTADFLTKKQVPNNGVLPQYYVEGDHEAIIPPETFELVQQEMLRRNNRDNRYSGVDIFASRIVCGECGSYYGAKVWHSNSKYRRIIYRCNHKYHDGKTCSTPNLTEDEIKLSFVAAVNRLIANKDEVIANLEGMCQTLFETETLESEREKLNTEMYLLQNMIQAAIAENAHVALEQNIYQKRFDELSGKYEDAKRQHDDIKQQIADKTSARTAASQFIGTLKKMDGLITEFDLSLWGSLLDHATVYSKEDMRYTFKDGTEIKL